MLLNSEPQIYEIFFENIFKVGKNEKNENLGKLVAGMNAPRCARGRKPTCKYLFRRLSRGCRGRGTHKKAHV